MPNTSSERYNRKDIFHLADLECLSSNLINALIIKQKDYRQFLLNYWNIEYFNGILVGSKNINLCFLDYLFGIKLIRKEGTIDEILGHLTRDRLVFLEVKASDLHFFPRNWLRFEDNQLKHTCLLEGYDATKNEFQVLDAILKYRDVSSIRQIEDTANENGLHNFIVLEENMEHQPPSTKDILKKATDYNHRLYSQKHFHFGIKALNLFRGGLTASLGMDASERYQWAWSNVKSINSLIRVHKQVWKAYCYFMKTRYISHELNLYCSQQLSKWDSMLKKLRSYRDNKFVDFEAVSSIKELSTQIEMDEQKLLKLMKEAAANKYSIIEKEDRQIYAL